MHSLIERGARKLRRVAVRQTARFRSPLRVGVVGYGAIAPDHVQAYDESGLALVAAVSDAQPQALASALRQSRLLRTYRDYHRMLEEIRPDVVSVCTWPESHAEVVVEAAAAGVKGVLCEKPLALSMREVESMVAACARHGVRLAGGHQYRFHPAFVAAERLIRSGALGAVSRVTGCVQGSLGNNGPHLIDSIRFLLADAPVERVSCSCRRERGGENRGIPAEDAASGVIELAGGIVCTIAAGDDAPVFFRIGVEGERGSLEVSPRGLSTAGLPAPLPTGPGMRRAQFGEFLRWVRGRQAGYRADGDQSGRSTEVVLALYESARLGRPVTLPLGNTGDVIRQMWPNGGTPAAAPQPLLRSPDTGGVRLAMDGGRPAVARWFPIRPSMGLREVAKLVPVVASRQLNCVDGRSVGELERAFAHHYGSPKAVASTSGTAAIHVALGALGLNPGDEVVTTPLTDMGSVIPILACNALPIFADVDPVTGNLTAETIAAKLTPRTKAVVLVHLFGRPAELAPICALLRDRGVALVEDCSQAHDAAYRGRKVGTFGDFGTFSLQQSKQITCGDGGVTLVNRPDLADRAALFVDKGWDRRRGLRAHLFLGMNYRMTELQGAVAAAQLERLPRLMAARRAAAALLSDGLRSVPGVVAPPDQPGVDPSWWMFPFQIDEEVLGVGAAEFGDALAVEGVRVRRQYLPAPVFEYDMLKYRHTYGTSGYPLTAFPYQAPDPRDFPGFYAFNRDTLYLPWSHSVRPRHVAGILTAVRKVVHVCPGPRRS